MDYQKTYDNLMLKARSENRKKGCGVYYEAHHIIPKCMGGEGRMTQWRTHNNIVLLTAKEHFIAHKLLVEINPKNYSLMWALHRMMFSKSKKTDRSFVPSSKDYVRFREKFSKMVTEQQKGKEKTDSHKQKLSEVKKGMKMPQSFVENLKIRMVGNGNPNFGNKWTNEMKQSLSQKKKGISSKVIWTDEMKNKLSEKTKGKYNGTEETKKKISQTLTGRKASDETKIKQSQKRKDFLFKNPDYGKGPQKIVVCPHCDKSGGHSNMTRYHFDNCKHKVFINYERFD